MKCPAGPKPPFENAHSVPCCQGLNDQDCLCAHVDGAERVLRHVITNNGELTAAQRDYCRNEISSVEGYSIADCEGLSDSGLAHLTLSAWADYARDMGML